MSTYRGLLTEREREVLRGDAEVSQNYVNQIRHRVRQKIEQLSTDAALLREHHPDFADALANSIREH